MNLRSQLVYVNRGHNYYYLLLPLLHNGIRYPYTPLYTLFILSCRRISLLTEGLVYKNTNCNHPSVICMLCAKTTAVKNAFLWLFKLMSVDGSTLIHVTLALLRIAQNGIRTCKVTDLGQDQLAGIMVAGSPNSSIECVITVSPVTLQYTTLQFTGYRSTVLR